MMEHIILVPVFLLVALLYSTVGLGGGSAYITAMVFVNVPKEIFPVIALSCNLLVAGQGALRFKKAGHFRWRLFWPFATTAIPFAYLGGTFQIPEKMFMIILACALFLSAARLLFWKAPARQMRTHERPVILDLSIGAALGLLAGITGIGGGIYLIPVLIFLKLATPHEASAVAGPFIVVNSIAGLFGQLSKGGSFDWHLFLPLAAAVIVGGFIGSKIGSTKLHASTLQKIVGVIMLIAVGKIAFEILG